MTVFEEIKAGRITRKLAKVILKKENAKYTNAFVKMKGEHPNSDFIKVVRNKNFLVQIFNEKHACRLSINRTELNKDGTAWKDGITWDEMQNIKNQVGFENECALEIYPPSEDLVNVANVRHIFIVKKAPQFMWSDNKN